jgi:hypothetical protein
MQKNRRPLRKCVNNTYVRSKPAWGPFSSLSEFSPLQVFVRDVGPTATADRKPSSLVVDVDLDVRVLASAVPRVSATFNHSLHKRSYSPSSESRGFKTLGATTVHKAERAE